MEHLDSDCTCYFQRADTHKPRRTYTRPASRYTRPLSVQVMTELTNSPEHVVPLRNPGDTPNDSLSVWPMGRTLVFGFPTSTSDSGSEPTDPFAFGHVNCLSYVRVVMARCVLCIAEGDGGEQAIVPPSQMLLLPMRGVFS